jgi:hypothetical protein
MIEAIFNYLAYPVVGIFRFRRNVAVSTFDEILIDAKSFVEHFEGSHQCVRECIRARIGQALIIYAGDAQRDPTITLAGEKHMIAAETSYRNGGMECSRFAVRVENVLGSHQTSFLR